MPRLVALRIVESKFGAFAVDDEYVGALGPTKLELLALEVNIDPDALRERLRAEIQERRRAVGASWEKLDRRVEKSREEGFVGVSIGDVTTQEDIAKVAAQLAELTQTVEGMAKDLKAMTERADSQQERADSQEERAYSQQARADNQRSIADSQDDLALMQQERIDLAARELADVSHRLQAAATMLQESVGS